MRGAAISLALLLPVVMVGCGGDDEPAAGTQSATTPEVTAPERTAPPDPAPARTTPRPATPPPPDAGHDPGAGGGTPAPPPTTPEPDTPQNDRPPPPGSPAERFEKECEENPRACG